MNRRVYLWMCCTSVVLTVIVVVNAIRYDETKLILISSIMCFLTAALIFQGQKQGAKHGV